MLILAGDKQNLLLYKKLISQGLKADIYGFDLLKVRGKRVLDPGKYRTIIAPIPFTLDGERLYSPYSENSIYIDDLLKRVGGNSRVIGGPFNFKDTRFIDITRDKSFSDKSVIPASEEILKIIIHKWDSTIFNSNTWIIGNGRLAKRLTSLLSSLGANIVDEARKADIVVNCETSQNRIKESLNLLRKSALIIDTSPKGERLDSRIIKARSLAIKSAPVYMAKTLYESLLERDIILL